MTTRAYRRLWILGLACGILAAGSVAADPIVQTIDLSGGNITRSIDAGDEIELVVVNKTPTLDYDIEVTRRIVLPMIPPPAGGEVQENDGPFDSAVQADPCAEAAAKIRNSTDEVSTKAAVIEGRALADCSNHGGLQQAIAFTRESLATYEMDCGQELEATITRTTESGDTRTWTAKFATPACGEWLTSYGFTFVPNDDEEYFSKSIGNDMFEITRKNDDRSDFDDLDFVPSIFYSYIPSGIPQDGGAWGWTFGLGFDQSTPNLFVGGGYNFQRFVSLIGGIVIHEKKHLDGQYEPMQQLMENLTEDKLHDESYGASLFIGASFRFNGNPFAKKTEPEETSGGSGN